MSGSKNGEEESSNEEDVFLASLVPDDTMVSAKVLMIFDVSS